ncbi:MAG: hypothetical protein LKK13_04395 [Bacilli bacterium]|jgi:hypothetical protein|nr:hypothetical protein [Bacilli bacterium]
MAKFFCLFLDALSGFPESLSSFRWDTVSFYVSFVLLGLTIVALIAGLVWTKTRDQAFAKEMSYQSSSVRVFRIDAPHDEVRYFNLSDMSAVKTVSMNEFFSSFPLSERTRVRDWIMAVLNGESHPTYLVTNVLFHKARHLFPSFLKIVSSRPDKGIVHLESYLLRYGKSKRPFTRGFATEADFAQAVKANGTRSGMTFCFALLVNESEGAAYEGGRPTLTPEVLVRFREAVGPFATGNQKIIQATENELIIANFDMVDASQGITFALRVIDAANKALAAYKEKAVPAYVVRAGIVANKDLLGDSDAILAEARRSAESGYDTNGAISFFKKGSQDFSVTDELGYRTEVERLIYQRKISYTYRPVFDCRSLSVRGYLARALPINSSFASIDELKNYAVRAKDERNLFAAIAKSLIPRFVNERPDASARLYYPLRMSERNQILPFFTHFPESKKANLVFLFREEDIVSSLDKAGESSFLSEVAAYRKAGYGFGLVLSGKSLSLDGALYGASDVFFVDFSSSGEEGTIDTKLRSALRALVEKLLKYGKPIIGSNLMSWNALELVVESGVDCISSDIFAPYDTMFRPVISRSIERVKAMKERK